MKIKGGSLEFRSIILNRLKNEEDFDDLAQIVQELERTLTEIARMPCLGELLGEESKDGCASCQAKEALSLLTSV